jgi:hypothetical protein
MKEVLAILADKKSDEFDLELTKNKSDEDCLAIFSKTDIREDLLPQWCQHTSECCNRSGHVCSDLPEGNLDACEADMRYFADTADAVSVKNIKFCVKFMLEFTGLTMNVTILRENRYLIHPCW